MSDAGTRGDGTPDDPKERIADIILTQGVIEHTEMLGDERWVVVRRTDPMTGEVKRFVERVDNV